MTNAQKGTTDAVDLVGRAVDIASAYVTRNSLPVSELPGLLVRIHGALRALVLPPAPEFEGLTPPVPIRKSITPDYLISLEDGRQYKTLKRHLAKHGLTPEQYRQKWGLPLDYPMVAANYAAQRSEVAKSFGLGQVRKQLATDERAAAAAVVTAPARLKQRASRKPAAE